MSGDTIIGVANVLIRVGAVNSDPHAGEATHTGLNQALVGHAYHAR